MILAIPQFSANSPITCAECVSGTGCNNVNWYCVFGSRGSITPLHSASAPIVCQDKPRRCNAASTRAAKRLESRITPLPPFCCPLKGYKVPQLPAHQNSCLSGLPVKLDAASAVQVAAAIGLATAAASGFVKKASSSLFQVGSSSEKYRTSKSM